MRKTTIVVAFAAMLSVPAWGQAEVGRVVAESSTPSGAVRVGTGGTMFLRLRETKVAIGDKIYTLRGYSPKIFTVGESYPAEVDGNSVKLLDAKGKKHSMRIMGVEEKD